MTVPGDRNANAPDAPHKVARLTGFHCMVYLRSFHKCLRNSPRGNPEGRRSSFIGVALKAPKHIRISCGKRRRGLQRMSAADQMKLQVGSTTRLHEGRTGPFPSQYPLFSQVRFLVSHMLSWSVRAFPPSARQALARHKRNAPFGSNTSGSIDS